MCVCVCLVADERSFLFVYSIGIGVNHTRQIVMIKRRVFCVEVLFIDINLFYHHVFV